MCAGRGVFWVGRRGGRVLRVCRGALGAGRSYSLGGAVLGACQAGQEGALVQAGRGLWGGGRIVTPSAGRGGSVVFRNTPAGTAPPNRHAGSSRAVRRNTPAGAGPPGNPAFCAAVPTGHAGSSRAVRRKNRLHFCRGFAILYKFPQRAAPGGTAYCAVVAQLDLRRRFSSPEGG